MFQLCLRQELSANHDIKCYKGGTEIPAYARQAAYAGISAFICTAIRFFIML